MGSICDLKEPGGGNIPLIWCLVLIGTLSSNTSWQTQQDKHSLSLAMKYTLSNRPVPFWIHCVGETKVQNKQHSDMALRVITASDRLERAGFGLVVKKHNLWLTWFPGLREVYLLIRAQRGPLNNLVRALTDSRRRLGRCMCMSLCACEFVSLLFVCGVHVWACTHVYVPTCSWFQSRVSSHAQISLLFWAWLFEENE